MRIKMCVTRDIEQGHEGLEWVVVRGSS